MRLSVHGVAQEQRWVKQLRFTDVDNQLASHRFQFQCGPKQFVCHIRPRLFLWYVWFGFEYYNLHGRKIRDITM